MTTIDDFAEPSLPVAGPDGAVWLWAASDSGARLFRVGLDGRVASVDAGKGESDITPEGAPVIAVDEHGTAWLGLNSTLEAVDAAMKVDTPHAPPGIVPNELAESHQPPEIRGKTHPIDAIAVNDDYVVTAADYSSSLEVLQRASGKFAQISLPTGDTATALAFFSNGVLAVAVTDYSSGRTDHIALYRDLSAQPTWVTVPDAAPLNRAPDGTQVIAGAEQLSLVDDSGAVVRLKDPTGGNVLSFSLGGHEVAQGRFVIADNDGYVVFNGSTGSVVASLPYAKGVCVPSEAAAHGGPMATKGETEPSCSVAPSAITTSGDAHLWALMPSPSGGVTVETLDLGASAHG